MSEKTVGVEFTETELRQILHGVPRYECWVTVDFMRRINTALREFDADREREEKVDAIWQAKQSYSWMNPESAEIYDALRMAGWDLVKHDE